MTSSSRSWDWSPPSTSISSRYGSIPAVLSIVWLSLTAFSPSYLQTVDPDGTRVFLQLCVRCCVKFFCQLLDHLPRELDFPACPAADLDRLRRLKLVAEFYTDEAEDDQTQSFVIIVSKLDQENVLPQQRQAGAVWWTCEVTRDHGNGRQDRPGTCVTCPADEMEMCAQDVAYHFYALPFR